MSPNTRSTFPPVRYNGFAALTRATTTASAPERLCGPPYGLHLSPPAPDAVERLYGPVVKHIQENALVADFALV